MKRGLCVGNDLTMSTHVFAAAAKGQLGVTF